MSQQFVISKENKDAIEDAAEVIRQIVKGNTAPDGYEARQAMRRLEAINPKEIRSDGSAA